jgi:prepilin-type N-terminal cleavage/methylation domain-containing protein
MNRSRSTPRLLWVLLRRPDGMSLIEVLVAMLLFATALIGLALVFPVSSIAVSDGGFLTVANGLAMVPIERAKRESFSTLQSTFNSAYGNDTFQTVSGYSGFQRKVAVTSFVQSTAVDGSGSASGGCTVSGDCLQITVTVTTPGDLSTVFRYIVTKP